MKNQKTDLNNSEAHPGSGEKSPLACGLVMPISSQPGCGADHWIEVKSIIEDAVASIEEPRFIARLVSEADDVGVIQKRIVQNLYTADVVVCDLSCKNPNVMFELGMRLAFDKPTVIVKDDQTEYSFDTGVVEHLTYPRDLRFAKIVQFKVTLAEKILATYLAGQKPEAQTFLKSFGTFQVAKIDQDAVSTDRLALDRLEELIVEVSRLRRDVRVPNSRVRTLQYPKAGIDLRREGVRRLTELLLEQNPNWSAKDLRAFLGKEGAKRWLQAELPGNDYFTSPSDFEQGLSEALELVEGGLVSR